MARLPLSLHAYRCATAALAPIAPLVLSRRAKQGKEDPARRRERLGFASRARPDGTLVWIHGASVGECLSALPLVDRILSAPDRTVLMTSGTVTSARLLAERLPPRAFHQFSPVDTPSAVARFLDHWRPAAGLFVDSEIWPNLLVATNERNIRLAMINGRMSANAFAGWSRARRTAGALLSLYDLCLVQEEETAERLRALGARSVEVAGSLKADSAPLPADPAALEALRRAIGERPVFVATNTHAGEDELLLTAHDELRKNFPTLLSIIVPRHAERGGEIAALAAPRAQSQRSSGEVIGPQTQIYLGDTMGELGLFYRLAPFAFIGKSLGAQGGQNPLEAVRLGAAVLAGPYTDNFREAYDAIFAGQGMGLCRSITDVVALAREFLRDPEKAKAAAAAAADAVRPLTGATERTLRAVETLLSSHARA